MRYKFTDDAKVRIILNTMHIIFRIHVRVSRLEQWPKQVRALSKGKGENCTQDG